MNNIFDFASSELSQDAFICWCLNWFNYKDNSLYSLAVDLLKLLDNNFDENTEEKIIIKQQIYKTDILIYMKKNNRAVIIEDKVYSTEHDDQIKKYKEKIQNMSDKDIHNNDLQGITSADIYTVYFKTGFYYDNDKVVISDNKINGKDFLNLIKQYKDKSEIISSYYEYLNRLLKWYEEFGSVDGRNEHNWYVSEHTIAQYNLMREIFPENIYWTDKQSWLYRVYDGTNIGGKPWTELMIFETEIITNEHCSVFWRIDSDNNGAYISLRFYDKHDKQNEKRHKIHVDKYNCFREIIKHIIEHSPEWFDLKWDDIKGGYTGNYNETTLLIYHIDNILENWELKRSNFIKNIRYISEQFLENNLNSSLS